MVDRNLKSGRKMQTSMKAPRFLFRGFRRPSEVATFALGKLERQVLDEAGIGAKSACGISMPLSTNPSPTRR